MNLRIPGPTPCPPEVLQAMTKQMINHRGPEFAALLRKVTASLQSFFQTKGDVFIYPSSGTGAMEAAVVNTLSPGDKVLCVSIGVFGNRFADLVKAYGGEAVLLKFAEGTPADPDEIRRALAKDPEIKAVTVTHNETSTGVTNDLKSLSAAVKEYGKLLLVDAVSSLGAIELPVDEWGCDVVASGSQKSWMIPPGLSMVSVGEKGWEAAAQAKMPRYYWDFAMCKKYLNRGENPYTPPVSLYYALDVALEMMEKEGLASIIARHSKVGQYTRDSMRAMGLELLVADERYASNTVTAVRVPEGVDGKKLLKIAREDCGVIMAGGQQSLEGKIFRIGHLGYVSTQEIDDVVSALRYALPLTRVTEGEPAKATGS